MAEPVVVITSDPDLMRKLGARDVEPTRRGLIKVHSNDIVFIGAEVPLAMVVDERVLAEVALAKTIEAAARAKATRKQSKLAAKPKRRPDTA